MNSYIIFLRGINVGGKNILPMKDLRALLPKQGLENIRTYIQSGNIVADASSISSIKIRSLIEMEFGISPEVLVLEKKEFLSAIKNNPFSASDGKTVHFYFCENSPKPDKERIEKLRDETEEYLISGKVLYLHAPKGIGRSKLIANIESCLGTRATGRNLNTVRKMQELAGDL